ncbi:ATP-binding protein [Streptomyces tirandamycinicus]|uniref:ATP-binding protein n=1 Tax=Streptomyces tirandamycinicus TaxID=2174846 RepID=UPI00226E94FC|nr:ATP-binding protein [Streptomyces tirandamycinicus]MCY0980458.1 ATP-binding protein [Streptomyces tirandamycinicus]
MDPKNPEPDGRGHDGDRGSADGGTDGGTGHRPPRDAVPPEFAHQKATPARTVRVIAGDFALTVNPVDGSEIEPCRPGERPAAPARHTSWEREERRRALRPPVPPGPAAPALPLLERQEERQRLVRLLGRGRTVRLTGPAGSGRTALLDAVAADCADLAPDGVVRLSGHHRTPAELLHELFAAVHDAPLHRPDRAELLGHVREIGAVVLVDDLEFGGGALDELLDATPECAFLLAATPDVPAPSAGSQVEEVFLSGLDRGTALELLERAVERPLTDEEANWAGDLWFESEGLPLRFVQAGALLRQRDTLRSGSAQRSAGAAGAAGDEDDEDDDEGSVFGDGIDTPLPTLGEGAAPAALLASRLSESARDTLRFAVALGGEVPHQAHLPALIGDTHADAALGELTGCALLSPVGSRYRLAAGVAAQLEAAGYAEGALERAHTAARHYAWWTGHPSVTPARASGEADAILAALGALVPAQEAGHAGTAVLLARSAAPAFAAGLHWQAWERTLRTGQEAARTAGEVAEEAYFLHELGVLALCSGSLDRARAELEASIAMRGALADKRGTVAGRRALALVTDREGTRPPGADGAEGEAAPAARAEEPVFPALGVTAVSAPVETADARRQLPAWPAGLVAEARRLVVSGPRRHLVAAGAGALLAVVLGTMVTLGAASDEETPADRVTSEQSANEGEGSEGLDADEPAGTPTSRPADGTSGGTGGAPAAPDTARPGESGSAGDPATQGGGSSTGGSGTNGSATGGSSSATGGTSGSSSSTGGPSSSGGTATGSTGPTGSTGGSPSSGGTSTGPSGGTSTGPSGGSTDGGSTDGGAASGGTTDGGSTDGGTADGGAADGGTTDGGSSDGGASSTGSPGATTSSPSGSLAGPSNSSS